MTVRAGQPATVSIPQLCDRSQRLAGEGRPAFEGMQHNAFEQIAEAHAFFSRKAFQNLEKRRRQAYARLRSINHAICYQGTSVTSRHHVKRLVQKKSVESLLQPSPASPPMKISFR